jgi:hypothetical protein
MAALYNGNAGMCDGCGRSVDDRASHFCSDLRCVTLCEECDAHVPECAGPRCEHEPESPLGACGWCAESWIELTLYFLRDRAQRGVGAGHRQTAFVA